MLLKLPIKFYFRLRWQRKASFFEIIPKKLKIFIFFDDTGEQFDTFLEFIQDSLEHCSSVEQCKRENSKPHWFHILFTKTIRNKKQAMKRFTEKNLHYSRED